MDEATQNALKSEISDLKSSAVPSVAKEPPACPLEAAGELDERITALWQRYQAIHRQVLAVQADVADLDKAVRDCGQRIYQMYRRTDARLDGEESQLVAKPISNLKSQI